MTRTKRVFLRRVKSSISRGMTSLCNASILPRKIWLLLSTLPLFILPPLYPSKKVTSLLQRVDVIHVASDTQTVVDNRRVELVGNVEVVIDQNVRIWADRVLVDKEKEFLYAKAHDDSLISIQTEGIMVTTRCFSMDLATRTGSAEDVRMHFASGFVSAKKMEKFAGNYWELEELVYTPCDMPLPHWSIKAATAKVYGNYLIKASQILFRVGQVPFFVLPTVVIPMQQQSQSGFLLPKIYFDQQDGFGIRQEFYWRLAKHLDTTVGLTWRDRRGIVISDELRWGRGPHRFTHIHAQYARERNAFKKAGSHIVQGTQSHYWIEGDTFESIDIGSLHLDTLIHADFGSDKRIGYFFNNSTERVSDYFFNSFLFRHTAPTSVGQLLANSDQFIRNQFSNITEERGEQGCAHLLQEIQDRFTTIRLPRFDWNTTYQTVGRVVDFKHSLFVDHLFAREQAQCFTYEDGKLLSESALFVPQHYDTLRGYYQASAQSSLRFKEMLLRAWIAPEVQLRSRIRDEDSFARSGAAEQRLFTHGRLRLTGRAGAEWVLPYFEYEGSDTWYWMQTRFSFEYTPRFTQTHWHLADKYDRLFARNELQVEVRNSWLYRDSEIDLYIRQAYEFNRQECILPLRRGIKKTHILPLQIQCEVQHKQLTAWVLNEFDVSLARLARLAMHVEFASTYGSLYVGCLYQDKQLQRNRELYSDIPVFLYAGIQVPLFKCLNFSYSGQFYARGDSWRTAGSSIRPLIHSLFLEYKGHCWSLLFGFEEKRYRQQGNWRNENAFILSISLDTLGSFGGKVRGPVEEVGMWR